jgi:dienelactone hydrolase
LQAITTAVARAREARGEEWAELRTFAAGHGFLCEAREDYQPEEARAAWEAILAFFATHLS